MANEWISGFGFNFEDPESFPEGCVFGRKADKLGIIDMLSLSDEEDNEQYLPVISVVGPGGIGKTTLAQLVACDKEVRNHFNIKMWVPMGDSEGSEPSQLLQEFVIGKKNFFVLDDVRDDHVKKLSLWMEETRHQNGLIKGSRILITTRSRKVAKILGTAKPYLLQPLDKAATWALCKSLAFWHGGKDKKLEDDKLLEERMEREIFKKTGGFPLFAKAWGGILLLEDTKGGWDSIMECEIWDASSYVMWQQIKSQHNVWDDVVKALKSSYDFLPDHLKRCSKYCSLFPKGCWIDKEVLTQLWMADEEDEDERKSKEDVGNYFDDLLSQTSFFKDREREDEEDDDDNGKMVRCKMYEPLHDIIFSVAKDECSIMTADGTFKGHPLAEDTLYSSVHFFNKTLPSTLGSLNKAASKLRTLLCFGNPSYLKVPGDFFTHLKSLRALI